MAISKHFSYVLGLLALYLLMQTPAHADYRPAAGVACGLTGPTSTSCPGFTTCGGDGRAGVCGCTPRSSFPSGACGVYQDNCGGFVEFGACPSGQVCGGAGTCMAVTSATNVACGATIQSNTQYKFSGGSAPAICFTIGGSVSNVVIDGDGKTLSAPIAFLVNNGAHNIVIKNFVIDSSNGVQIGTNVYPDPTSCAALPRDIRIEGNRFVQGWVEMGATTAYGCNFSIQGNRFDNGGIALGHNVFEHGVGGHILVDNVIERRSSTGSGLSLSKIDNTLVLHNSLKHLGNIGNERNLALVENRIHVTGAIGGTDNNGVSMLMVQNLSHGLFAGNYIHNQESTSPSIYRMAINTYGSQGNEYLWNTIIQQLPNPYASSEQMALNFRSAGNDNYIYRNFLRSYYESGYALKTLSASSNCVIDIETGATGSCNPMRNVIDSNTIVASSHALYLSDSGSFTVRNNVLVAPNDAVYGCGSPANTFVHNLLDGGAGFSGGSCAQSANNIVYSGAQSAWFKNRANFDYHLLSGAGAINQVAPHALAAIDLAGINRPFGANADSGPHEFINDSQLPTTPGSVTALPLSWSRIRLTWAASSDNDAISHYNVYVYSGGSFVLLKSVPFTRAYDVGLNVSTLYRYKVSAVDRSGNESAMSGEVSATTPSGPSAPQLDTLAPGSPLGLSVN